MKIIDIVKKLEKRIKSQDKEDKSYQRDIYELIKQLNNQDPNALVLWSGDCEYTGDHYPVDKDGNIHFDKKRFFRKGERFPDDEFIWIPSEEY